MDLQIILPILLFVQVVNSKDIFDTESAKKEWNDLSGLSQGILIVNKLNIFERFYLQKCWQLSLSHGRQIQYGQHGMAIDLSWPCTYPRKCDSVETKTQQLFWRQIN